MNKAKLIPFDIEKVKDGAKVITRCGYPAMVMIGSDKTYPVRAIVKTEEGSFTYSFTLAGKFSVSENESDLDLFIEEEEKEKLRREYSGTDSIYVPKDDDGIREELIDAINGLWDNDALPMPLSIKRKDAWLAWLEKQGEEKPADNKPKFQKGDWVVFNNQGEAHQIVRVAVNGINQIHGYDTADNYYFSVTEESVRLWDITKDAKPGDVLCCCESGWTCIFKAFVDAETFSSYCFMDADKWFYETGGEHTLKEEFVKAYNGKIRPATKEQRDLFFQKIKERGYQWDSNKKELHKMGEKVKTRKMTYKELSWWLREHPEEHREYTHEDIRKSSSNVYSCYDYNTSYADEEVNEYIRIRKNGGEWMEPLIEE